MAIFPQESHFRPVNPVFQGLIGAIHQGHSKVIASRLLPGVDTGGNRTGTIVQLGDTAFGGDLDAKIIRAEGADYFQSPGVQMAAASTFYCQQRGIEARIPLERLTDADVAVDLYRIQFEALSMTMLIELELAVKALIDSTTYTTTTLGGASVWSDSAADPLNDIENIVEAVSQNGPDANSLVLAYDVGLEFRRHASVADLMPTTGTRHSLSRPGASALLAARFGIPEDRIFWADASYNGADMGQSASIGRIWSGNVWAGYVDIGAGRAGPNGEGGVMAPIRSSAAARFVMTEEMLDGDGNLELPYRDYDWVPTDSRVLRVANAYDLVAPKAALGKRLVA